jgi:hypothetical protein
LNSMSMTVFDCKEISAARRKRIEAAVEAAGQHLTKPYEGWIAVDRSRGGGRCLAVQLISRVSTPCFPS